jgi:hypothetical protein
MNKSSIKLCLYDSYVAHWMIFTLLAAEGWAWAEGCFWELEKND